MDKETVRTLRIYFECSQKSFASKLGVSESTIAAIETGRRPVSAYVRTKILQVFDITDDLLDVIRRTKSLQGLE
jgi:transcriptional regulator with XRE-family HTH domain